MHATRSENTFDFSGLSSQSGYQIRFHPAFLPTFAFDIYGLVGKIVNPLSLAVYWATAGQISTTISDTSC
jgi:hypothetical protein